MSCCGTVSDSRNGSIRTSVTTFVADGKVYIGTETGFLWVLKASKELQVLSKTRLKANPITLTAADGVLYIPTQHNLLAIPGKPAAPRTAHIAKPVPPPAQTHAERLLRFAPGSNQSSCMEGVSPFPRHNYF